MTWPAPRKSHTPTSTPQKYCSDRCRREKPSPSFSSLADPRHGSIEATIERAFVHLLGEGKEGGRRIVKCEDVQQEVFVKTRVEVGGAEREGGEGIGMARGGEREDEAGDEMIRGEEGEVDEEDDAADGEGGVRLPTDMQPAKPSITTTTTTEVPDSRTGTTDKEEWHLTPQAFGQRVARQREKVRQAARRGVAFGFVVCETETGAGGSGGGGGGGGGDGGDGAIVGAGRRRRKVEAVQYGRVVEASFAKGEWGVRWKE